MNRFLAVLLASTAIAFPVAAALQQGETAPVFTAQASLAGKTFNYSLKDALKTGPVVVYFYPSAFTGGCNAQAHAFSENKEKFTAAGATIIGVSLDSIARLNDFSADPEYCAGKIAVASDVDGKIAKSYGLMGGGSETGSEGFARCGNRSRLCGTDDVHRQPGWQDRCDRRRRRADRQRDQVT